MSSNKQAAKKLLNDSIKLVESKSIRQWATSDHPLWLQIANQAISNGKTDPLAMATYIGSGH
jgi:hypothetical protein